MTEKNYKKIKHFLNNRTKYSDVDELVSYLKKMSSKEEISEKEWGEFFEIILQTSSAALVKGFLSIQPYLGKDISKYASAIVNWYAKDYSQQSAMTEIITELIEYAPEEQKKDIQGKTFVTACLYNNIVVVKFLLEQGIDVTYNYKKMTGESAALKYAKSRVGKGDATLYQYLHRNKNNTSNVEEVEKYFEKSTFGRRYKEPQQEKDLNDLNTSLAKEQAIFIAESYGYDKLLSDATSAEELDVFLEEEYNWDDGFELPFYIALHKKCELATALRLFWKAEGIFLFREEFKSGNIQQKQYLKLLYERILNGVYKKGKLHYIVPIDAEEKKELKQCGADEIILNDV